MVVNILKRLITDDVRIKTVNLVWGNKDPVKSLTKPKKVLLYYAVHRGAPPLGFLTQVLGPR